jgi:hypothetical protein
MQSQNLTAVLEFTCEPISGSSDLRVVEVSGGVAFRG